MGLVYSFTAQSLIFFFLGGRRRFCVVGGDHRDPLSAAGAGVLLVPVEAAFTEGVFAVGGDRLGAGQLFQAEATVVGHFFLEFGGRHGLEAVVERFHRVLFVRVLVLVVGVILVFRVALGQVVVVLICVLLLDEPVLEVCSRHRRQAFFKIGTVIAHGLSVLFVGAVSSWVWAGRRDTESVGNLEGAHIDLGLGSWLVGLDTVLIYFCKTNQFYTRFGVFLHYFETGGFVDRGLFGQVLDDLGVKLFALCPGH